MALPVNSVIEKNGVKLKVTDQSSSPAQISGSPTQYGSNGADQITSAYSGAPGGNVNYASSGRKGLKIPDFSGLDKALGVLGTATALGQGIASLVSTIKGSQFPSFTTAGFKNLFGGSTSAVEQTKKKGNETKEPGQWGTTGNIQVSDWRVKLNCNFAVFGDNPLFRMLSETRGLVFPYTPSITLTHKANYTQAEGLTHTNFPFASYKNSQVEDITISSDFSVQNTTEGWYWLAAVLFLRSATKMFYGASQPQGFPPVVCRLEGYGSAMFNNVPVVVKSFQLELKDNVQYMEVPTMPGTDVGNSWVPLESKIIVTVMPMYNREKVRQFSLEDFAKGKSSGVL